MDRDLGAHSTVGIEAFVDSKWQIALFYNTIGRST